MAFWNKNNENNNNNSSFWNVTVDSWNNFKNSWATMFNQTNELKDNGESLATVYTCVRIKSDTISRTPINIIQSVAGVGNNIDSSDYRFYLFEISPNGYQKVRDFWATMTTLKEIHGNSYAFINKDAKGTIKSLEIIEPSRVNQVISLKWNPLLQQNEAFYSIKGIDNPVNAMDILHFKTSYSKDGFFGHSPLTHLRLNLATYHAPLKTMERYYNNNMASTKVFKTQAVGIGQKNLKEESDRIQEKYTGAAQGTSIFLPAGMDIEELQLSYADVTFINTIKFNTLTIAAAYGVPASRVGIIEAAKYSSVEQAQIDFISNDMASDFDQIEEELNFKLLTVEERHGGKQFKFDTKALMEYDIKTRYSSYESLTKMFAITPNQICVAEGLPTMGPAGDQHYGYSNARSVEAVYKLEEAGIYQPNLPTTDPQSTDNTEIDASTGENI